MVRKWMVFALSTGLLVSLAGVGFSADDDEEESELQKIMEKVNKTSRAIKKGTRNPVNFKRSSKDVAKKSKEMVKLAKDTKPMKDAIGKAKNEENPQKKWDELMDDFIEKSEKLSEIANKSGATYDDAKKAFSAVSKSCADCHRIFRVEDDEF